MFSFWFSIQLTHSYEVEHHFLGLTNPDVNFKRMHRLFCYMTFYLTLFRSYVLFPVSFNFSLKCIAGENLLFLLKAFCFKFQHSNF